MKAKSGLDALLRWLWRFLKASSQVLNLPKLMHENIEKSR